MRKQLIVNADDFGIHEAINRAVCEGFGSGILTSTSLMAGGTAFASAVSSARSVKGLGIGVHLTLVGGLPTVLPPEEVPTLTWEGGVLCRNYLDLIRRDMKGLIRADDVYREWDGQVRKILDTGLSVTHMDGHQHLHMWPKFFKIALALAVKYHIPCMRVPDENFSFGIGEAPVRYVSKDVLTLLSRLNRGQLEEHHIGMNDHFWGMMYGGGLCEEKLLRILGRLEDGVNEVMCHPSADAETMEKVFHWGYRGDLELQALCSQRVRDCIERGGIELISYENVSAEMKKRSRCMK